MIYTVTLNPAIDKTVVIENFALGKVNRIHAQRIDAGGKGINVTKCLASLGLGSIAAILLGGSNGEKIRKMLAEQNLQSLTVSVAGETRTNLKVIDPVAHSNTDINEPGPDVTVAQTDQLKAQITKRLKAGDIIILSGSLPRGIPAGLYAEWCRYFRELGALVYLDVDGEALREGIQAAPYLIKPNDNELSQLLGKPVNTTEDFVQAGLSLMKTGIEEVVISLGAKGALFMNQHGCYLADALKVPVRSTVGAGDSMVAAMAYSKEKGLDNEQRIHLAIAMGAASVMCDGTQAPEKELVMELAKQVIIREVKV